METARHQPKTLTLLTMTCHFCQFYLPRTPTPIASLQSDHLRFLTCSDPQHLPPTTSAPLTEKYSHLHLTTESHHHHLLLNHLKKSSIHHRESCVFTTIAGQNLKYFFVFRLLYQFLAMDNSHALRMSYFALDQLSQSNEAAGTYTHNRLVQPGSRKIPGGDTPHISRSEDCCTRPAKFDA